MKSVCVCYMRAAVRQLASAACGAAADGTQEGVGFAESIICTLQAASRKRRRQVLGCGKLVTVSFGSSISCASSIVPVPYGSRSVPGDVRRRTMHYALYRKTPVNATRRIPPSRPSRMSGGPASYCGSVAALCISLADASRCPAVQPNAAAVNVSHSNLWLKASMISHGWGR